MSQSSIFLIHLLLNILLKKSICSVSDGKAVVFLTGQPPQTSEYDPLVEIEQTIKYLNGV